MRRSKRRKTSVKSYSETEMANKFEIRDDDKSKAKTSIGYKKGPTCEVFAKRMPIPKRCSKTGTLKFTDHPEFRPNLTPKEVLHAGSFGGTYFRPIYSSVTGKSYKNVHEEFPEDWFKGLNMKRQVTRSTYDKGVNKYGVKCGGDLHMWESSGWISDIDPYGWFQWYCRFYLGRRSSDDQRQISRGNGVAGVKGRFRNQLIGRCSRAQKCFDDVSISPVIRQALLHWGYELTEADADAYISRKHNLRKLPRKKKK